MTPESLSLVIQPPAASARCWREQILARWDPMLWRHYQFVAEMLTLLEAAPCAKRLEGEVQLAMELLNEPVFRRLTNATQAAIVQSAFRLKILAAQVRC